MKLLGKHLQGALGTEKRLRAREVKRLSDLPSGHPLEASVTEAGSALGGDLSGLPPGHPLLRELAQAQARMEGQEKALEVPPEDVAKVRRAKKLDASKVRRQQRDEEEARSEHDSGIAKTANEELERARSAMEGLASKIDELHDQTDNDYLRIRLQRLRRMAAAFSRGLAEGRVNISRTM